MYAVVILLLFRRGWRDGLEYYNKSLLPFSPVRAFDKVQTYTKKVATHWPVISWLARSHSGRSLCDARFHVRFAGTS